MAALDLLLLPEELALCRLEPDEPPPEWSRGGFVATVRTDEELSVVCPAAAVPAGVKASAGWRAFRVAGTLDLSLTGVLAALLGPLERAEIPIFAISSFDTDHVLVPGDRVDEARAALASAGHRFG